MPDGNDEIVEKTYAEMTGLQDAPKASKNDVIENAFKIANECRNKEIDRFWTRGLYFWGFITASFAAYMAVFNASLKKDVDIAFSAICGMSVTSKIILFVLSFVCFIFCLSWLLSQKGSKFWQKNWEKHIDYLEEEYIGKIFNSYLDTDNKNKFSRCLLSVKPYRYSVSKISILCSMLITLCSFGLVLFHFVILILGLISVEISFPCRLAGIIIAVAILGLFICFIVQYAKNVKGNKGTKKDNVEYNPACTYFEQNNKPVMIIDAGESVKS